MILKNNAALGFVIILLLTILSAFPSTAGASQEISLKPGFNFVAFTVAPELTPDAFKRQYPAVEDIYYFSSAAGSFLSAGEGTLTALSAARGYILKSLSQSVITVAGNAVNGAGDVNLKAGFNLAGFSLMPESVTAGSLMTRYTVIKGFYKWLPASGSFIQLVRGNSGAVEQLDGTDPKLIAGESYFMNMAADGTMNCDGYEIKLTWSPVQEQVAAPVFNKTEGAYNSTQSVEISCPTSGAEIFYTLDGSEPGTAKTKYTSAITVSATTTIKAVAVRPGMFDSQVASVILTIKLPAIQLTYVPSYGSINEYLTGRIENVNSYGDHACVLLIRTAGKWWIKPGYAAKLTVNPSDGTFSCNYSNGGEDYLADKIKVFLIPASYTPPNVENASEPPAALIQNSIVSIETDIQTGPRWALTGTSPYSPCSGTFEVYYGGSQYLRIIPPYNIVRPVFGPKSSWGAYFYFMPAVRTGGKYYPDSSFRVDYFQTIAGKLWLSISGSQGGLNIKGDLIISPPANDQLAIEVKINEIGGGIVFDTTPENEIVKLINVKSAFLNSDYCDSTTLFLDSKEYPFPPRENGATEANHYQDIISSKSPVTAKNVLLKGAYSKWQQQNQNLPSPSSDISTDFPMPVAANNNVGTAMDVNSDTFNAWYCGQTNDLKPYRYKVTVKE